MATYVNLQESDPVFDFALVLTRVQLLDDQGKEVKKEGAEAASPSEKKFEMNSEFRFMAEEKAYEKLITTGFVPQVVKSLRAAESVTQSVFNLCYCLLGEVESKSRSELVKQISALVSGTKDADADTRLDILVDLFNVLDETDLATRFASYVAIAEFALENKLVQRLWNSETVSNVEAYCKAWKLQPGECVRLHHLTLRIAQMCEEVESVKVLTTRYLEACEQVLSSGDASATKALLPAAKKAAADAVKLCIKAPFEVSSETQKLARLAAVAALQKDPAYATLYALFAVYVAEDSVAYQKLAATPGFRELLKAHADLDEATMLRDMRILTLCAIGCASAEADYKQVMSSLGLKDADELEDIVIAAVVSKQVDAKLDQANSMVLFQHATQRKFDPTNWKAMGCKLSVWKENVKHMLANLHHATMRT